jgi:hypothetical protein
MEQIAVSGIVRGERIVVGDWQRTGGEGRHAVAEDAGAERAEGDDLSVGREVLGTVRAEGCGQDNRLARGGLGSAVRWKEQGSGDRLPGGAGAGAGAGLVRGEVAVSGVGCLENVVAESDEGDVGDDDSRGGAGAREVDGDGGGRVVWGGGVVADKVGPSVSVEVGGDWRYGAGTHRDDGGLESAVSIALEIGEAGCVGGAAESGTRIQGRTRKCLGLGCRYDVRVAVAVEVSDGYGPHGWSEKLGRRGRREGAVAITQHDRHRAARTGRCDQIEIAVTVEVRQGKGIGEWDGGGVDDGRERPGAVAQEYGDGVIGEEVYRDQIQLPIVVEVGHEQTRRARRAGRKRGSGCKGSVAVAQEKGDGDRRISEREVKISVAVKVSHGHHREKRAWRGAGRLKGEGSVAVAQVDARRGGIVADGDDIQFAVVVEVANDQGLEVNSGWRSRGGLTGAAVKVPSTLPRRMVRFPPTAFAVTISGIPSLLKSPTAEA